MTYKQKKRCEMNSTDCSQRGLELSFYSGEWKQDHKNHCWRLENAVTVRNPLAPELQCINIYVPEQYLAAGGRKNAGAVCGAFTAETAPVILENGIGGYAECRPRTLEDPFCQGRQYLDAGMVYITAGARGRQTKTEDGTLVGKSPAGLVDLKAAVRFIRHNREVLPGNTERIISVGVSAGGAMSALLGCTGNSGNYTEFLKAAGACMEEKDDVFASQCYCPIIDLDHADIAYEWMFDGDYKADGMPGICAGDPFSEFQKALSGLLSAEYVQYFNSLHLVNPSSGSRLLLSGDGKSGSGYEFLMDVIENAAAKFLRLLQEGRGPLSCTPEQYLTGNYRKMVPDFDRLPPAMKEISGDDKSSWLKWDGHTASVGSFENFKKNYLNRLKPCSAFDTLDKVQAENQEFGDAAHDFVHFDVYMQDALEKLKGRFPTEYAALKDEFSGLSGDTALTERKYLINPFSYIGTGEKADLAEHYRIRVGTHDPHTSFTMAMTLALKLKAAGCRDVNYEMVWDFDHGPADYAGEVVDWITGIV